MQLLLQLVAQQWRRCGSAAAAVRVPVAQLAHLLRVEEQNCILQRLTRPWICGAPSMSTRHARGLTSKTKVFVIAEIVVHGVGLLLPAGVICQVLSESR